MGRRPAIGPLTGPGRWETIELRWRVHKRKREKEAWYRFYRTIEILILVCVPMKIPETDKFQRVLRRVPRVIFYYRRWSKRERLPTRACRKERQEDFYRAYRKLERRILRTRLCGPRGEEERARAAWFDVRRRPHRRLFPDDAAYENGRRVPVSPPYALDEAEEAG